MCDTVTVTPSRQKCDGVTPPPLGGVTCHTVTKRECETRSWTLSIPSVTPSLNETRRMHWAAIKRAETVLEWEVVSALNRIPKIPPATGKRRLTICRHGRNALDQDNLAGGCKGLVDFIKLRGLLVDDRPRHAELVFTQKVTRKGPTGMTITIEDLVDEAVA